jgi:hypothetical protein
MRGHGVLLGAADITVKVEKQDGIVTVKVDKANDLADDERPQHSFTFRSITLSDDPLRTASVLIPADDEASIGADRVKAKAKPKLTDAARIALTALAEAINDCGEAAPSRAPAGTKAVSEEMLAPVRLQGRHQRRRRPRQAEGL